MSDEHGRCIVATARDTANYFLTVQTPENDITNLKLQKLCAYAQAMSLALLGRPLFDDEIEAWMHGPVVSSLYDAYEGYGSSPLPAPGLSRHYAREPFDDEQKFILELVDSYYGSFSAWTLRERSHRDFPGTFGSKEIISQDSIREAFSKDQTVVKLRKMRDNATAYVSTERLVSEEEVMNALGF